MKTQFLAFLSFAVVLSVDAATVHKAPLKRLLIDNDSVVTDVTGFGSATRLETADGRTWIDAAGNVGQVQRKAVFNGMEAVSGKDPAGGTVAWMFYDRGPEGGCCQLLYSVGRWDLTFERLEDVDVDENGDVRQEMVQRTWSANAPWGSSTVTLNGDWGTETVQLAFVTNVADRLATTGEVARIASGLGGGLTTNDVCAIVTNEVAGGRSEWMWHCENPEIEAAINANPPTMDFLAYVDTDITSWGFIPPEIEGFEIIAPSGVSCDAPKDATYLYFAPSYRRDEWSDEYDGYVEKMYYLTATRERITRNALGLAMMKDLEKLPTHETVTNVARSVVNSVWDASLGVAWEARMHNGHLYYIAVTNRPPEVK